MNFTTNFIELSFEKEFINFSYFNLLTYFCFPIKYFDLLFQCNILSMFSCSTNTSRWNYSFIQKEIRDYRFSRWTKSKKTSKVMVWWIFWFRDKIDEHSDAYQLVRQRCSSGISGISTWSSIHLPGECKWICWNLKKINSLNFLNRSQN